MTKLVKQLPYLLVFAILLGSSEASRSITETEPHVLESFKIKPNQTTARSCSYTVIIKTSCSSPSYTRDQISLDFGDAYGNEVYAKRLDDPRSRIFERCSSDTFQIRGPCTNTICYLYLLRVGSDGWKPESVKDVSEAEAIPTAPVVCLHHQSSCLRLLSPELCSSIFLLSPDSIRANIQEKKGGEQR
ncbi:hypothetical protein M9H77_01996 [Catharanthus roseus]|uniref:Uncharacterized protein n=1 Tax=Catharanthus roseus TaxID=4058 RepID=A0ACC0C796_CATRO|nr:hypothetical protein M9H77_01996 [Catharanthus roseus]